jgi:hypothetical protein
MSEPDEPTLSPARLKHLEMIQAVIARLGNDSFLVKGWAVTVSGVFLGLAVSASKPGLALVSLAPTLLFWVLDSYYLRSERLFRAFYERARTAGAGYLLLGMDGTSAAFVQTLTASEQKRLSWSKTFWRPTLRWLYLALALAAVLVFAFAPDDDGAASDAGQRCPHSFCHVSHHR